MTISPAFLAAPAPAASLLSEPSLLLGFAAICAALVFALTEGVRDARRRARGEEVRSTMKAMGATIALLWLLCAACVAAWLGSGRSLEMLGLTTGEGWRALAAWAAALAFCIWLFGSTLRSLSSGERRAKLAQDIEDAGGLGYFDLRSRSEAGVFQAMAVTAGITEEIIFRGFVLLAAALVLPLWAAALASALLFIVMHAYQGVAGMIRIAPITVVLTGLVLLGETLWPAILVHVAVDMVGGLMLWGARDAIASQRGAVR